LPRTGWRTVGRRKREEKRGDTWCVLKVQERRLFILEVEELLVRKRRNLCGAKYFLGYKKGKSLN